MFDRVQLQVNAQTKCIEGEKGENPDLVCHILSKRLCSPPSKTLSLDPRHRVSHSKRATLSGAQLIIISRPNVYWALITSRCSPPSKTLSLDPRHRVSHSKRATLSGAQLIIISRPNVYWALITSRCSPPSKTLSLDPRHRVSHSERATVSGGPAHY
ncbi:hypothetical protein J6590_016288 [Homalodisca vitripennis]|nr:hypothetical protein J6590_016288 [Homalodisca vitripennis]